MKKITFLLLSASIFCFAACSEEKQTSTNTPDTTVANQAPVQNTATTQPVPATTVALNPPHGEPNHRCDIPVGQPLNSAPTTAPVPAAPVLSAPVFAPPVKVAPGTNPPHGQPGHDCALPVGAPLNK